MDRSVSRTLLLRGWTLFSGLVVVTLVPFYLNRVAQGYYYTFSSLIAIQIFFELGLSQVLVYRFASLFELRSENEAGDSRELGKLLYAARYIFRILGILFFVIALVIGYRFFSGMPSQGASWLGPWIALVVATSVNLVQVVKTAYLEATGHLSHVSVARMRSNIIATVIFILVISLGGGLWAASVFPMVNAIFLTCWLYFHRSSYPYRSERSLPEEVNPTIFAKLWMREIFPMQWKISLSWLSGYFIFQLYTPIVFARFGPIQAGKLGYLISIMSALAFVATTFTSSLGPSLSRLFAGRRFHEYNTVFDQSFVRSSFVLLAVHFLVIAGSFLVSGLNLSIADRLLNPVETFTYCLSSFLFGIVGCLGVYLRSQQREPFLLLSIASAFALAISLWIGSQHSVFMMLFLALCANILLTCWAFLIYCANRASLRAELAA